MRITSMALGICLLLVLSLSVQAEIATKNEMEQVARNWLAKTVMEFGQWGGVSDPQLGAMHELWSEGRLTARYYDVEPGGFILVPILKEMVPVKVYSDESDFDGFWPVMEEVLNSRLNIYEATYGSLDVAQKGESVFDESQREQWNLFTKDNQAFLTEYTARQSKSPKSVGPIVTSVWHQQAPYNNYCPIGDGGRSVVGCVATAAAQIINYWKWPDSGIGELTYNWDGDQYCGGDYGGGDISAVFSDPYDWDNIGNFCDNCSAVEQAAFAELNFEVGVSLRMDYGACGSGANYGGCMVNFFEFFKYSDSCTMEARSENTFMEWYEMIQEQIDLGRPMYYNINMHGIVCDGYRLTSNYEYHMNYGWGGNANGWYVLDALYCPWITGEICPYAQESLCRNIFPYTVPDMEFVGYDIDDAAGDNDWHADPGETVHLDLLIKNLGVPTTGITGTIASLDPYVTVNNSLAGFEDGLGWKTIGSSLTRYGISIAGECPDPWYPKIELTVTADGGYTFVDTFMISVGDTREHNFDFESNNDLWSHKKMMPTWDDQWHPEGVRTHSGDSAWKMGGPGYYQYDKFVDGCLISPPILIPPNASFKFWHWMDSEITQGTQAYDGGIVMISPVGSDDWTQVFPIDGYSHAIHTTFNPYMGGTPCYSGDFDWQQEEFDLTGFSGEVQIMFRYFGGGYNPSEGWYVDDVEIIGNYCGIMADTTIGWAPFEVQFEGWSNQPVVDSWQWTFGDGDSAINQTVNHTYEANGMYDVSLKIDCEGDIYSSLKPEFIIVFNDSLKGDKTTGNPGETVEVVILGNNTIPLDTITIAMEYSGNLDITPTAYSRIGCRTEDFEQLNFISFDPANSHLTAQLIAGDGNQLEPGRGALLKLTFMLASEANPEDSAILSLSGYDEYQSVFNGPIMEYSPLLSDIVIGVASCCKGMRGNVDNDPVDNVNVVDLTDLVSYLFGGGDEPDCPPEANIDGDTGERINVVDLTHLVTLPVWWRSGTGCLFLKYILLIKSKELHIEAPFLLLLIVSICIILIKEQPLGNVNKNLSQSNRQVRSMNHRIFASIGLSFLFLLIAPGLSAGGLYIDHVEGGIGYNQVLAGEDLAFHVRMVNNTGSDIYGFTNAFQIYSPDGADIETVILDTVPLGWSDLFNLHVKIFHDESTEDIDTIGFGCVKLTSSGIPDGFDDIVWSLRTSVAQSDVGKNICIDSAHLLPSVYWIWETGNGTYYPEWGGPYCYKIVEDSSDFAQIMLDTVIGLNSYDQIMADEDLTFEIRYSNYTGYPANIMTNGFRIYSPDGARWHDLEIDTCAVGLGSMFNGAIEFTYAGCNGRDADTVGFGAYNLNSSGLVSGFNENVLKIYSRVSRLYEGRHLCIDSCWYPPSNHWLWTTPDGVKYPDWGGPHCFEIYAEPLGPASVTLDTVMGMLEPDKINYNEDIEFIIRIKNTTGFNAYSIINGFRLYSPDGAVWEPLVGDTLNLNWLSFFDLGFFINHYSCTGEGADTVGFAGVGIGRRLPNGFDEQSYILKTRVDIENLGKSICLDSCKYPPNGQWLWDMDAGIDVIPDWGGPYCFEIAMLNCCVGRRGNFDNDPGDNVNVVDLTELVAYLFGGGPASECPAEANIDGDIQENVNVVDLTFMIDFLFNGGPAPPLCP